MIISNWKANANFCPLPTAWTALMSRNSSDGPGETLHSAAGRPGGQPSWICQTKKSGALGGGQRHRGLIVGDHGCLRHGGPAARCRKAWAILKLKPGGAGRPGNDDVLAGRRH